MAVGTGIGLNLSDLDKAFKKADQHIKNLTDKTNGLQKDTINAFQQMAQKGVLPYVKALKQQKKYLEEISKAKGSGAFFDNMRKEAKLTIDEINKVIRSLEQTKRFQQETSGKSATKFAGNVLNPKGDKSIDNLRNALSQLEAAQNRQNLNTTQGQKNYEKLGRTISRVKEELDKATGSNKRLTEESQKTQSAFKKLGGAITAAFALNAIKQFVNQMIKVRGEFEMQHRSLQVLLQDKEAADALWDKTVQLAVKSPFRVKDLVTYTKNLAAYRVEADKLYETNKMLADVSAGLGVDMNRLILAFGQVKAANFLRGTELRQFSEAGVNMLEELAKRFTMLEGRAVSVGEVFERVSKRMVSFKDVEAVFKTITSEGGMFYQMQEKQSETLRGMIMNLKDSLDLMFNKMGESNESVLKKSVSIVIDLVNNWQKLKPVINGVTMALVTTLVGAGISKVIKGFTLAKEAFIALMTAIRTKGALASIGAGPWIALATILVGVVTTIAQAIGNANRLQKELNKVYAEDTENLDKSIARYQDLVNRLRQTNQGSQERRDIIEKINNEYGKYLDFIVTEQTEIDKLVDSYDILVKRMKEKAAASTYEKAFSIISDEYQKKMLKAQKEFEKILSGENFFMNEKPLEAYGLMQRGKNLFGGETAASIMPTKQEINDLYSILEQRLEGITKEEEKQLKKIEAQKELINSIVSSYYGKEFYIRFAEGDRSIDIIKTIIEKKEKEREIEEQISRAYQESLKSREARLAYDKLELEYTQKQAEIRAMPNKSPFEVNKALDKLREEFELNKIEIKFKFGQIGDEERDRLRNNILNWATSTTKDVNNEIRRQLSNFMTEEDWSNFLITQDKQAQGMSGIIKEITNGYETQMSVIKEQISLKSAGRKIDEKGLEYAQKQAKAYEVVADILGIELKTQDRISEELRKQINDLMPEKQKISLEDSYKSVKEIQDETNKAYKSQVEVMTTLINQKRAGMTIDYNALETAREDLELMREKMRLLGMKVEKPVSETTRNSINYFLPEEFKISEVDALAGITRVNQEAAKAFEDAQKELQVLLKMQDQQVEGLEDEIRLLESQLPYLQRKVELTGNEVKDRLSELQLIEINAQLSEEYQLDEINLYKSRSTIISEIQAKEKEVTDMIRAARDMREEGLTIEDGYLEKLQEEYLAYKGILDLIDPSAEEPINRQRLYDINSKLDTDYWIDVIDSQKSEVTLLQEANTEKEKAIAYEAQLLAMQKQGITVTEEQLALAKKDVEQWTLRWKLLGGTEEEKTTSTRQNSLYDERIKVIDDMNKKYRELAKTLPDVEAKQGAFNAYIDAFAEAYKDIKWIPSNVRKMTPEQFAEQVLNFPNEDALVAFLDKLAKEPMKAFEKIKVELAKGEYVLDAKVRVKKEGDTEIKKSIQELFDQYDLSLELKKLNIPKDLAKSLFDVDYLDLDGLKKAVQEQEAKFIGTDMEDEYKKFLEKISDLTRKAQADEAKEFINFLKKNLDEIKLIQDKGAYNIALADRLFGEGKITAEQYMSTIRQIVEDTNREVAKVNLEKFKDSATYIKAMGNLAAYSRDELKEMMSALQGQVGANAGNMGADEIRAYYEALERLVDQYDKLESPFQKGEINDLIEYLDLQKQLNQEKEKEAALEQRKEEINNRLVLLQRKLASQQASGNTEGAKLTQSLIKSAVNELKEVDGQLVSVTSNISVISEKVANLGEGMVKSLVVAQKVVNEIANIANASTKMFDDIKSAADALGADTESGGWAKAGYAMEMVGGVSSELTSGLANLASGNFAGALANVVGIVTKLISGFAKIHDQNYQDIIDAQAKEVERLGRAYEKLEKATEDAYSIEQLQQANKELERNVELQMQALRAMMAAERAKKNTDEEQIAALNEELEALTQQWEDLKQSLVEGVGGVSDYRSQTREFVDSWVSAFQETGNGLDGLKNNFREFFDNIIAEQAALRVTEKFLEPFYKSLDTALGDLKLTEQESKSLREEADKIMPELSKALELIWNQLGGSRGEADGGSLSALQKGIQGITEDTAQIIEAYLNSIRGYVSEQVTHTKNIYRILNDAVHSDAAAIRVRMV